MDEQDIVINGQQVNKNIKTEPVKIQTKSKEIDVKSIDLAIEDKSVIIQQENVDIDYSNHSILTNRDLPNQHPIAAITNLASELNELKRIKPVLAPAGAIAMFYPWIDPSLGEDRVGYFIECISTNAGEIGGIQIATGEHEIIGVSVSQAGYSGNYAKTIIDGIEVGRENDQNYGLVGLVGVVNVRCTGNIPIGSRVMPDQHGKAVVSENGVGYYVLAKGNNSFYDFVTIYLGATSNQLSQLADDIIGMTEFTPEEKQKLHDAVTVSEFASVLANTQFVINQSNINESVNGNLGDIFGSIEDIEGLIEEIQNQTTGDSSDSLQSQIDQLNTDITDIQTNVETSINESQTELREEFENAIDTVSDNISSAQSEIASVVQGLGLLQDEFEDGGTVAEIQQTVDEHTAQIANIVAGDFPAMETITEIQQKVDEQGGLIQHLVMDISKYSVGEFSQSYGMSYDDAVSILSPGIIYVPTVSHYENLIRDIIGDVNNGGNDLTSGSIDDREDDYSLGQINSISINVADESNMHTYNFEISGGVAYRYTWNGSGWVKGAAVPIYSQASSVPDPETSTYDLWFCSSNIVDEDVTYEQGTLYELKGGMWVAVANVRDNQFARAINVVRQTAESFSVQLRDLNGDFSLYEQTVDHIKQVVGGTDGNFGELIVTKNGLYGEVYGNEGAAGTLKSEVLGERAIMELLLHGYYHKLLQTLSGSPPSPATDQLRYSARPMWDASLGQFVFIDGTDDSDGIYYFSSSDHTKYVKLVGNQYEVYGCGNLSAAGVDANITNEKSTVDVLSKFGGDLSTAFAGVRTKALENEASLNALAELSTDKLNAVVIPDNFEVPSGVKYASRPTWNGTKYVFSSDAASDDGLYYRQSDTEYRKLISDGTDYIGYESYSHDSSGTAGLVAQVLDNESKVGLVVDQNGVKAGAIIESINGQSSASILADKIDITGNVKFITADGTSGGTTYINGGRIKTGSIQSNNYSEGSSGSPYSTSGTKIDLSNGAIISKNFAIDSNGNLHLTQTIDVSNSLNRVQIDANNTNGVFVIQKNNGTSQSPSWSNVFSINSSGQIQMANSNITGSSFETSNDSSSSLRHIKIHQNDITFYDKDGYVISTIGGKAYDNNEVLQLTIRSGYDFYIYQQGSLSGGIQDSDRLAIWTSATEIYGRDNEYSSFRPRIRLDDDTVTISGDSIVFNANEITGIDTTATFG